MIFSMTTARTRILKGFSATALNQAVMICGQLVFVPLLVTYWGVPKYGAWLMMATIPTYLSLSDLGFATAAGTDMAIKIAQDDVAGANRTFAAAWALVSAATACLGTLGISIVLIVPSRWLDIASAIEIEEIRATVTILILYSLACVHMSVFAAALRADRQFPISMSAYAATFFLEGVAGGASVIMGGSTTVLAVVVLLTRLGGLAAVWLIMRRRLPWLCPSLRAADARGIIPLLGPSVAALAMPLAQAMSLQGTTVAVGLGAGPAAVAVFTTVRTAARVGLQLSTLVTNPLVPEYSAAYALDDRKKQWRIVGLVLSSSLLIALPAACALAVIGPHAVGLWTRWLIEASRTLIVPMAFAMLLQALWLPASSMITGMNKQAHIAFPYLVISALFLPLTYLMAAAMGVFGGALSTLAAEAIMLLVVFRAVRSHIGAPGEIFEATRNWIAETLKRRPNRRTG